MIIILILIAAWSVYLLFRNKAVAKFRSDILELAITSDQLHIYEKHSHRKMLFSLKPLDFDYWFTQREINLLFDKCNFSIE
jgi:hypothetical protein